MRFFSAFSIVSFFSFAVLSSAEINVVLVAGQSNAAGRADAAGLTADPADVGVEYFYNVTAAGGAEFDSGNGFVSLATVNDSFGPEFTLARTLKNDHLVDDRSIIKRARGGTNLFEDWSPGGSIPDLLCCFWCGGAAHQRTHNFVKTLSPLLLYPLLSPPESEAIATRSLLP